MEDARMSHPLRKPLLVVPLLLLAGCGKKLEADLPLAYVPADTPYVLANVEPAPAALSEANFRRFQPLWKPYFAQIDAMLDAVAAKSEKDDEKRLIGYARAVLAEIRDRDTPEKWREIGFTPEAHAVLYGIGLAPVMRLELADPQAFRAMLGRVEAKTGEKLAVAKIGEQEYWRLGPADAPLSGMLALEGRQLVLALAPKGAPDATLRQLLGLDRPAKSLAASGALERLNQERGYLAYGSGYVDLTRIAQILSTPLQGSDADFARALDAKDADLDPTCRAEIAGIAAKAPRLTFGATRLDAQEQTFVTELELDPALREQMKSLAQPLPGMAADDKALADMALAVPVLKWKDFLLKQANAVTASPYRCGKLASLNTGMAELKTSLERTVPPPFSNILGLRVTLDRFALDANGMPDTKQLAMRVLIASDNPLLIVSMAQLAVPDLKDIKLATDGKPVQLPAPSALPDRKIFAASSTGALALAIGDDAEAAVGAYLAAPAGDGRMLLHLRFSGEIYGLYAQFFDKLAPKGDPQQTAFLDIQRQMYARYREWMDYGDVSVELGERGLRTAQHVRYRAPTP